jgi:hypothetical protein
MTISPVSCPPRIFAPCAPSLNRHADTYTTDPAYGDGNYVGHYTDLWSPTWQHFDNLDHIRPDTGVPAINRVGVWNLPGRDFPGPAADPVP